MCLDAAAQLVSQGIGVTVADTRWVTPVPVEVLELAAAHRLVPTMEDNSRTGGIGSHLTQIL